MINIVAKPYIGVSATACRLPFYLAIEEWVAGSLSPAEYFFTWRVNPTVIIGRNQRADIEVDLDYCRTHGIQLYRRRSGGGCVYADPNNLMMSYITPSTQVTSTFASYTDRVALMLRSLGLEASATGRNDVLIGADKVSGNAFYHVPGRSIVHGTMLYDVDIDTMSHAITPSKSKLMSNGVKSVASRVTCVSRHKPDLTVDDFEQYIINFFTDQVYELTDDDMSQIRQIEERYYDLRWTFGRRGILGQPKSQRHIVRRVDGVGSFDIIIHLNHGKIDGMEMSGDFFMLSDLDSMLFDKLKGCTLDVDCLRAALAGTEVSEVIAGLNNDRFIDLILTAK